MPRLMINTIVIAIITVILFPSWGLADAVGEGYSIRSSAISDTVRIDCIGVFTIVAPHGSSFEEWRPSDTGFVPVENISFRQTIPVSVGHLPSYPHAYFRYPVVTTNDSYYQIVIDPVRDKRVWICETDYDTQYFDYLSLIAFNPGFEFVDVFYFTNSGQRKYYSTPQTSTDFKIYSKPREYHWEPNYYLYSHLNVVKQEGDFLFLKEFVMRVDYDYEDIGWFRIHDDRGRLMVWPLFEQLM